MHARVTHATPKSRHRAVCDAYPINLNLRLYRALSWLARGKTAEDSGQVFNHLFTLRNQLIHGGATWASQVNCKQFCGNRLGEFVPLIRGAQAVPGARGGRADWWVAGVVDSPFCKASLKK
jgi:hypothetical protein